VSLFRKEAISHQSERLTGVITLAQPLAIKLTVTVLVSVAIVIVAFLYTAEYSRKETVRGFLMPNKGVIKSFAAQGGTIEELLVAEGDTVEKGQKIATVVLHKNSADGLSVSSEVQGRLASQLLLIDEEIAQYRSIQAEENLNLENRAVALESENKALTKQLALIHEKLNMLQSQHEDVERLNDSGFISTFEKNNRHQVLLETKQEKQNVARLLLQLNNQTSQIKLEKANLPEQYTLRINNLLREKANIENQLAQVKSSYTYSVVASHAGTVTGIQVVEGETLSASRAQSKPLLHILPAGSELIAELLLPTRSAGFVQEGQVSRLRFDAFPYQRFGFVESQIVRIDRALIAPNEIQLPIAFQEPVYRLRAKLTKQQMHAYGTTFELKSGMLFEADIMLERRSLIEWLLEPIYSLKGRVG